MEETYLLNHPGVKKKILAGGSGPLPHFPPGTKLVFHFQTLLDDFERTVIDDSRLAGRPAEIFVGKMFKMEVWETLLMSMRIGEVAEFWCDALHTGLYPIVSKGMRLIAQGRDPLEGQKHMCGMGNLFNYHSTGFPELDELMRTPQPLIFIMELLQVGDPLSYHRESWMMEKDEKLHTVPVLHMEGNTLVKQRQFREAASKYKEAVLLLKTVQSREMPGDIDHINLGRMIIPLELNYCQCMLELEEYYEVIEHADELLDKHKDCVKGYYKRAKAHAAVWNEKEARRDFNMVAQLDVTLVSLVSRELKALSDRMKEKYWEEKEAYWNMLEKMKDQNQKEDEEAEDEEAKEDEAGEENGGSGEAEAAGEEGTKSAEEAKEEEKDWQQMLRLVMLLQNESNFLIKEKRFEEASEKLKEALGYVDVLQNKNAEGRSDDLDSLEKVRLPLTLNLSQCSLELKDYQRVVELNNKLLKKHKGHFKAVYQRARAHAALCNEDEARRDLALVEKLDPNFKPFVRNELKKLGGHIRVRHSQQNKTYMETTREKWGPGGSRTKAAAAAGAKKSKQKSVKFAPRDTEITTAPVEKNDGDEKGGSEGNPLVTAEQGNKDGECEKAAEEVLGNENTGSAAVQGGGPVAPDNRGTDKDSDPAPTGTGPAHDNAASKRSPPDTAAAEVKCQSNAAPDPCGASRGNKDAGDKAGNGDARSEETDGEGLSREEGGSDGGERGGATPTNTQHKEKM